MTDDTITLDSSRSEILREAASCFMEKGYAATSIDDVARRLGSTKGRIYHHYSSKSDLFADVFRTGMAMNFAVIKPLDDKSTRAVDRWLVMAQAHTAAMIRTRAYQRVVWEGVSMHLRGSTTPEQRATLSELMEARSKYSQIFRHTLEEARADGDLDFENGGIATELMFLTLNSPLFWYKPRSGESDGDVRQLVDQIVTFAHRGLGGKGFND